MRLVPANKTVLYLPHGQYKHEGVSQTHIHERARARSLIVYSEVIASGSGLLELDPAAQTTPGTHLGVVIPFGVEGECKRVKSIGGSVIGWSSFVA